MGKLGDHTNIYKWPACGLHPCRCIGAEKKKSEKKKTPFLELQWATRDGCTFTDSLFVTPKAINRLALVAQRVCKAEKDMDVPDDKAELASFLANYIFNNVIDKDATVEIEQYEEEYMATDGPDMGQLKKITKKRVAFNGYMSADIALPEPPPEELPTEEDAPAHTDEDAFVPPDDDLPF